MITFQPIQNSSDPLFTPMHNLYIESFPAEERRESEEFRQIMDTDTRLKANALMKEGQFMGFFNYWVFENFYYVEHFAVNAASRGQNIGSKAIGEFLQITGNRPVILEVELPDHPMAVKRISFYERLGFHVMPQEYIQPSYGPSDELILPMLIMSNDPEYADTHFHTIKKTIYEQVYNTFLK